MSAVVAFGLIGLAFLVVAGIYAAAALRKIYDAARDVRDHVPSVRFVDGMK
jgi:hypothetical protein